MELFETDRLIGCGSIALLRLGDGVPPRQLSDTDGTTARPAFMEQVQSPSEAERRSSATQSINTFAIKSWGIALGALVITCPVWACSGVGPPGKPVVFGDQTNIIIWDEAQKTEHFIRNASFRSGAESFGFIAPTPGKPELSEASSQAFFTLASLAPVPRFAGGAGGAGSSRGRKSDEVKVIQEADVAGYHATTLFSTSARAINNWMNEHGYVSTPEVEKWCERYTAKGWYLTAFKVIDRSKLAASTGTLRMSFKTDKAFNPFYVPKTNIQINRNGTLRVYFVSVGDYDAKIGAGEIWQTPQWKAAIPAATADLLAKQAELPAGTVPDKSQVTMFVDTNFPRPAVDDIFFTKKEAAVSKAPVLESKRTIPPSAIPALLVGLWLSAIAWRRGPTA
jgi:hypothetical protein